MTTLDDKLVPGVKKILNKVGASATLTSPPTGYSPSTGANTTNGTGYSVKITPPGPFERNLTQGDLRYQGDAQTLLSAQLLTEGSVPTPGRLWVLQFNSQTWTVIGVEPIASGDSICAYVLDLRSGVGAS